MWIVRLALRRPYTFVVMSLLILILGTLAVYTTPIDIFPNIDIPMVASFIDMQGFQPRMYHSGLSSVSNADSPRRSTISSTSNRNP